MMTTNARHIEEEFKTAEQKKKEEDREIWSKEAHVRLAEVTDHAKVMLKEIEAINNWNEKNWPTRSTMWKQHEIAKVILEFQQKTNTSVEKAHSAAVTALGAGSV